MTTIKELKEYLPVEYRRMQNNENPDDFNGSGEGSGSELTESAKKMLEKSKEKLRQLSEQVHESVEDTTNGPLYAALSYFPVIGPVIALLFKRNIPLVKQHAKNAAYIQGAFSLVWLAIWLLENLPLVSFILKAIQFIPYMTNAFMYLDVMLLIALSSYGAIEASQSREFKAPWLYELGEVLVENRDSGKNASE